MGYKTRHLRCVDNIVDKREWYGFFVRQLPDKKPVPFSFINNIIHTPQVSCFITHTNKKTHKIISNNLEMSPMYSGAIKSMGARYCPSIEDKVVKFPNKNNHQIFLEPEGPLWF